MSQCLVEDNSFSRPTGTDPESVLDFEFQTVILEIGDCVGCSVSVIVTLPLEVIGSFLLSRELGFSHVLLLNGLVAQGAGG